MPDILRHIPNEFERYFEPFLGGAAVFFALQPKCAVLADENGELINCYIQLRDRPQALLDRLRKMSKDESSYYRVRSSRPIDPISRASRLIYLATLSFNGIYRVNLQGKFNVPYGHRPHLVLDDEERVMAASQALQGKVICQGDFADVLKDATAGDVAYLDPPYTVAHGQNGFLKYNARIFSWDDQCRLAQCAHALVEKGCTVLVSNAAHSSIAQLYDGFSVLEIERYSVMSARSVHRKLISEYLMVGGTWRSC